jgi:hypothetical protein
MNALRDHFVHHRTYMLGCLGGALLSIIGGVAHMPILEVSGAVLCTGGPGGCTALDGGRRVECLSA